MSEFVGKQGRGAAGGGGGGPASAGVPGKATQVDMHAAAEAGTAGPGGALPHLDQIQRSFGRFDVSGVQAHVGGEAAGANAAMGSQAYTHGDHVAFGAAPDLHLAAHEATHVVQQRGGVQLKGGVGSAGDAYERHADAVADVVVAGGDAQPLLQTMAGGGGGAKAVQHQAVPQQGSAGGAVAGAGQASADPVQRVRSITASNDIAALIDLQSELRRQMAANPMHPPQEAREGLFFARVWAMERVSEIRVRYQPRLDAARTGQRQAANAPASAANNGALDTIQTEMDNACSPYLRALMAGDPQYRYFHPDQAVQDRVFAAVRLHASLRGLAQLPLTGAAQEAEADQVGGLHHGDEWCGAFAFTQGALAGGMDSQWAGDMQGELGIRNALHYTGTQNLWLWFFDHWEGLREYHTLRGSLRYYEELTSGPPSRGIEPGDIVLIDNAFGTNPDHITTAVSFDGRWLRTVGGNERGGRVRESDAIDLDHNATPNDVTDYSYHGTGPNDRRETGAHKNWRVHGVGRWSIVDFERHVYMRSAQRPTAPPREAAVRNRS